MIRSELWSFHEIRCPKCGATRDPRSSDQLYSEGEIAAVCLECEHEFEVRVVLLREFRSPAMEKKS